MANTPEGKVKDRIKKLLKSYHIYFHMPVQNGLGSPALDFTGCHLGRYFTIEAKAPGKKPTVRQLLTLGEVERCKGKTFVIDGPVGLEELENWIIFTGDIEYARESGDIKKASTGVIEVRPEGEGADPALDSARDKAGYLCRSDPDDSASSVRRNPFAEEP